MRGIMRQKGERAVPACFDALIMGRRLAILILLYWRTSGVSAQLCKAGTFAGTSGCEPCPVDTYGPAEGMVECIHCPYQSTSLGVDGGASVYECACNKGYYMDSSILSCASCPSPSYFFECPGGISSTNEMTACNTVATTYPEISTNWWRPVKESWPATYQRCWTPNVCTDTCGGCLEGYTGPLCQTCVEGRSRNLLLRNSLCDACPAWWIILLRCLGLTAGLGTYLLICCLALHVEANEKLRGVRRRVDFTWTLKLGVHLMAVWSAFGTAVDGPTNNPISNEWVLDDNGRLHAADIVSPWFQRYMTIASSYLNFSLPALAPECWMSHHDSPLYLYSVLAFVLPMILITFFFGGISVYFFIRKRRIPASRRALLYLQGINWRDVVGHEATVYFSWLTESFLYLWGPISAVYFFSTFTCRDLATDIEVQQYDPRVACGGEAYAHATQLSLPGLLIWTFGYPIVMALLMVFYIGRLHETRYLEVFCFLNNFYSTTRFWWECFRSFIPSLCIVMSLVNTDIGATSLQTVVILIYGILLCLTNPYGKDHTKSWKPFKRTPHFLTTIEIPRTRQIRELAVWISVALGIQFDTLRTIVQSDNEREVFQVLVVLAFLCAQLLVIAMLMHQAWRLLKIYFPQISKWNFLRPKKSSSGESSLLADSKGSPVGHKFYASDERFFHAAVRLSPFPAEALAQLHRLADFPDLAKFDILDASAWIFEGGCLEPQGQTIYAALPRFATMYSDLSYDINTSEQFSQEMHKLLYSTARGLRIEDQVNDRQLVAARVVGELGFVAPPRKRRDKDVRKRSTAWQEAFDVPTDADAQMRYLQLTEDPDATNRAARRLNFASIFPSALPVCRQKEFEKTSPILQQAQPGIIARVARALLGHSTPVQPVSLGDPLDIRPNPLSVEALNQRMHRRSMAGDTTRYR